MYVVRDLSNIKDLARFNDRQELDDYFKKNSYLYIDIDKSFCKEEHPYPLDNEKYFLEGLAGKRILNKEIDILTNQVSERLSIFGLILKKDC